MDPLTALSTTCNALQLFQIAWKVVAGSLDIYNSVDGTTLSSKAIEGIANAVTKLSDSVLGTCDLPDELHELSRLSKDVGSKLSALLCKVTAQCPHSKWQSFRAALKETWSKGQIREFTDQLQQLQIQAIASIQFLIMNKQSDVYNEILSLEQATDRLGASFHVALDQLRQDIMNQLWGLQEIRWQETMGHVLGDLGQLTLEQPVDLNTISAQLNTLSLSVSQLQRDLKETRSNHDVLRTIGFDRLKFRHDRIERAHAETFSWVFEDHAAGVRGRVSLHFRDWLRNRDGIFWIRGKAGSGKSTLMKFLCGDGRTRDNLLAWSGGPQHLVVAKYFFWSAGTPIQKSQEGLMRSLIYDILCQRPERIQSVQKRLAQRHDETQEGENIWSWEFLLGIFGELITVNSADRICCFIDGLDEYDGDCENLLQTINLLGSYQGVKVCASSRPWSEFVQEFGDDVTRLLEVENLTAQDIRKYVKETLSSNSRFRRLSAHDASMPLLLDEIVYKSSGVFLWVRLVVKSLLQGLKYADSKQFLWKRLRSFPSDLDNFFLNMLNGIPPIYRAKAASTFKTAMTSSSSLPAMVYYFIDNVDEDEHFALNCGWNIMPDPEVAVIIDDTALRMDGWTKGLLEVVHYNGTPDYALSKVEFLHRTVLDFMEQSEHVRQLFRKASPRQHDTSAFVCHGSLAFLKQHPRQNSSYIDYDLLMNIFYHASLLAGEHLKMQQIYTVLDDVGLSLKTDGQQWKGTPTVLTMCEYAAEYGLKDYLDGILTESGLDNGKCAWFTSTTGELYDDLLRRCLQLKRFSTHKERSWLAISKTVTYLLDKDASLRKSRSEPCSLASRVWNVFLEESGERIRHGDRAAFDICCTLVARGAPLDAPFGNSVFLDEVRRIFPEEQVEKLQESGN